MLNNDINSIIARKGFRSIDRDAILAAVYRAVDELFVYDQLYSEYIIMYLFFILTGCAGTKLTDEDLIRQNNPGQLATLLLVELQGCLQEFTDIRQFNDCAYFVGRIATAFCEEVAREIDACIAETEAV